MKLHHLKQLRYMKRTPTWSAALCRRPIVFHQAFLFSSGNDPRDPRADQDRHNIYENRSNQIVQDDAFNSRGSAPELKRSNLFSQNMYG